MKRRFLPFFLIVLASMMAAGSLSAAPQLTYNGEVLAWNTEFDRTLLDYLNPDAVIPEVSGIACSRVTPGYLWMESDEIQDYLIATDETGQTRFAKVQFPGENYLWDWEDLCGGVYNDKNYLFIGAFGDNNEERNNEYGIVWFEEPEITGDEIDITPSMIKYGYPDGKSHNAEAIMYDNVDQTLYIITKVYYNVCQVFSLPFRTDYGSTKQTLTYVCDLGKVSDLGEGERPDKGFHLVTAADISPDGKYILIKNQNNTNAQYSWILLWERQEGESVADVVKRQPQPLKCYEVEWQGEAICWRDNNTFFTTSDSDPGERPPLYIYTRKEAPAPAVKKDITIDGNLSDWDDLDGFAHAVTDEHAKYDKLYDMRWYADEQGIYFYLEFSGESYDNSEELKVVDPIDIYLSTDDNSSTGISFPWDNPGADFLIEGSAWDIASASFLSFNGEEQNQWDWYGLQYDENFITACEPVSLNNGHKAIEVRLDAAQFPTPIKALKVGIYSNNSEWNTQTGSLPQVTDNGEGGEIASPLLEVPIYTESGGESAFESIQNSEISSQKVIMDGMIYIVRDGKLFNLTGAQVR